jgi:hypothetical protein
LDKNDNVIDEMPGLPYVLESGSIFGYSNLLVGKPRVAGFKVTVVDPNQNDLAETYERHFEPM